MVRNYPEPPPFTVPERDGVTREPRQVGTDWVPAHNDREWIGFENQGAGAIPNDYAWSSNPKQQQDDLGNK